MVPELKVSWVLNTPIAMAQGDLTLDAGYMWVNYWDAHHNIIGPRFFGS